MSPISMSSEPPNKLLTIFSQGRNDQYMGNFLWRLGTAINNHARNFRYLEIEDQVELLVCDWGSEVPLYQALDLSEEARLIVKFLMVPPELAKKYNADSQYSFIHPLNALARRAQGKYLLFADSDVLVPLESMGKLMYHLRQGHIHGFSFDEAFFWSSRYHIPTYFNRTNPPIHEVDSHIEKTWLSYRHEQVEKVKFKGAGVSMLTSRAMWHESSGWDERLIYWGWFDIDLHRRLETRYVWDDLERHGIKMFHLEHYQERTNSRSADKPRRANEQVEPTEYCPNPPNWGLADHELLFVDGFGQPCDRTSRRSRSYQLVKFDCASRPRSAMEIVKTNQAYQEVSQLAAYEGDQGYCNLGLSDILLKNRNPRTVCEVGSGLGAGTAVFAQHPSVEQLYCIDEWNSKNWFPGNPIGKSECSDRYRAFLSICLQQGVAEKTFPVRLVNHEAVKYFQQQKISFDLIYIKQPGCCAGLLSQILAWCKCLNPSGMICLENSDSTQYPPAVLQELESLTKTKGWEGEYCADFFVFLPDLKSIEQASPVGKLVTVHTTGSTQNSQSANVCAVIKQSQTSPLL